MATPKFSNQFLLNEKEKILKSFKEYIDDTGITGIAEINVDISISALVNKTAKDLERTKLPDCNGALVSLEFPTFGKLVVKPHK